MTTEGKVSPLPWSAVVTAAPRALTFHRTFWQIGDADNNGVAFAFGAEREGVPTNANAAFIVRAVNAHDRLVAALETMLMISDFELNVFYTLDELAEFRAAIAAAKEGQ